MAEGGENRQQTSSRQLGALELMYHRLLNKFNTSIYFQSAILKSNYLFGAEDVIESLKVLVEFQPFLRMKVVEKLTGPGLKDRKYFLEETEVDVASLLRVKTRCPTDELSVIIGEEEEDLFNKTEKFGDGPMWRATLTTPEPNSISTASGTSFVYEIVFIMQHMLVDAVSSYDLVYRQFLPILNQVINKRPVDEKFLSPVELAPSFEEEFYNMPNSSEMQPPWYVKMMLGVVRAKNKLFTRNLYEPILKSIGSPFDERGAGPMTKVLKKEVVDRILEQRNCNSVSVHSILLAAFSFALAKLMSENDCPLPNKVKSGWTIDSRKQKEKYKSPQPLGMFIADSGSTEMQLSNPFIVNKEEFWQRAKELADQVQKQNKTAKRSILNLYALSYLVVKMSSESDMSSFMSELGMLPHFTLSNLSKCSPGPELSVTSPNFVDAEEMFFGICGKGFQWMPLPFFSTATYHNGQICIALCYNKRWVDWKSARQFADDIENILIMACC